MTTRTADCATCERWLRGCEHPPQEGERGDNPATVAGWRGLYGIPARKGRTAEGDGPTVAEDLTVPKDAPRCPGRLTRRRR